MRVALVSSAVVAMYRNGSRRKFLSETSEAKYMKRKISSGSLQTNDPKLKFPNECFKAKDPEPTCPGEFPSEGFQAKDRKANDHKRRS